VSTPDESFLAPAIEPPAFDNPAPGDIDPDKPSWGLLSAVGVWLASVVLLFVMQMIGLVIYFLLRYRISDLANFRQIVAEDQVALIFVSVLAIIPAHLLTLLVVWAIVTGFGQRPFWQSLGWGWSPRVGLGTSIVIAVVMLIVAVAITQLSGGDKTQLDQIIASSPAARIATALLATATAPLIEEMVYRGVLYSALRKLIGALWAVVGVSALFTFVHVFQYSNNLGVIAAIALLSLTLTATRALTGRLLPCFVIHLIFNGVQAATLLAEPYLRTINETNQPQAVSLILLHALHALQVL
jgi:membrane protease YdiL (CAAX protease family)